MKETTRLFVQMWANGGRPVLIAACYLIGSLLLIGGVMAVLLFQRLTEDTWEPLEYINPQTVSTNPVLEGTFVTVSGTKCNNTDKPVATEGTAQFRRVDAQGQLWVQGWTGTGVIPPGCVTRNWNNSLPEGVTPGTWIIEGREIATDGAKTQIVSWYTQPFMVVSDGQG